MSTYAEVAIQKEEYDWRDYFEVRPEGADELMTPLPTSGVEVIRTSRANIEHWKVLRTEVFAGMGELAVFLVVLAIAGALFLMFLPQKILGITVLAIAFIALMALLIIPRYRVKQRELSFRELLPGRYRDVSPLTICPDPNKIVTDSHYAYVLMSSD